MCRTNAPGDDDLYRRVCRTVAGRPFDRHWLTGPKAARSGCRRRQLLGATVNLACYAGADRPRFAPEGTSRSASAATRTGRVEAMPVVNRARACLLAIGIAALTTGCTVGPDFERPEAPEVEGYAREPLRGETAKADIAGGETQRFVQDLDIPGQWWTLFHSEALNALIEQALRNHPTLPAAEAALRLAWENVYAAQVAFSPTVVPGYSPSRNKTATGVVFTSASSGKPWFTLH